MLVTPDIAREWLKVNSGNRNVRQATVKYLADQIRVGRFERIGDGIDFHYDGRLLNGQHRLLAIIMADMAVELLVVPGLSDEAYTVRDRGNNKSASDVLHLPGNLLADASLCFRITTSTAGRISEMDQRDITTWWLPAHEAMIKGARSSKGLSSASIRVGFGARWAIQVNARAREYVATQYKAMMANDTDVMTKATAALWKRFSQREVKKGSSIERVDAAVLSFYCADPVRANVAPLMRDAEGSRNILRAVIVNMEEAYTTAPLGAEHPYMFPPKLTQTQIAPRLRQSVKPTDNSLGLHLP
jgi:hypothetical protein